MRFSLRLLAPPLVVLALLPAAAWAQRVPLPLKDIRLDQMAQDTQRTKIDDDTIELVWLIPSLYWQVSATQQQELSEGDRKRFLGQLDDYLLIAAVRGKVGLMGIDEFAGSDALLEDLRIVDAAGTSYSPLSPARIPSQLKNLLAVLRPVMANMLGPMGDNMHFAVFNARDAKGKQLFDPLVDGRLQVRTANNSYPFRTPLGSVLPPQHDPKTGESFPGDYHYNPYTGGALQDSAQPR
ncbi:hypothetical protein LJR143_002464 [Pseudoxanthomonas sp. LjRoot143]|uniref:hypothetical protein n=1 Tax=Pseudoxanthomonas sp. LjRoot143 TaxID=3342266 RepID=UPI003ECD7790